MPISKQVILGLYKRLFRYGQRLTYTDKSYYFTYIRGQFESVQVGETERIERLVAVSV